MKFPDRLRGEVRFCLDGARISQVEAARTLGISTKHLSQMLTGKAPMSADWAEKITQLCDRELIVVSRAADAPGGSGEAQEGP